MAETRREPKADARPARQMPLWAVATLVAITGATIGIVIGFAQKSQADKSDAVARAFAAIAGDERFWNAVRDSGYTAQLKPELSTSGLAHMEARCIRDVACAPFPHRGDAKVVILKN